MASTVQKIVETGAIVSVDADVEVADGAANVRICKTTGLVLVAATGQTGTRIQKVSYGAMAPLKRPLKEDAGHWGRYDVPGHSTIYLASTAKGAYAESLASQRIPNTLKTIRLSDVFDDSESRDSPDTVFEAIRKDWNHLYGGMTPGKIVMGWRDARLEYPMTLPPSGWVVDIEASSTVATLNSDLRDQLGDLNIDHLSVGDLRGENRYLTTAIAGWVHSRVLDDGSLPHGIVYGSKHGSDYKCWAIWLRNVDDGKEAATEPTKAGPGKEIDLPRNNPPLQSVASQFGLKIY